LDRALLILHAPLDEVVGIENAGRLYAMAKHPKSFVSLDGADHLLTNPSDSRYVADVLAAWAGRYVGAAGEAADELASLREADRAVTRTRAGGFYTREVRAAGRRRALSWLLASSSAGSPSLGRQRSWQPGILACSLTER